MIQVQFVKDICPLNMIISIIGLDFKDWTGIENNH